MTVRLQNKLNLWWLSAASFISIIVVVVVSAVLTRDDKYVTVAASPETYDNPSYRSMLFFGREKDVTTYFAIKIMQVPLAAATLDNASNVLPPPSWFDGTCEGTSKDTCVFAHVASNHTVHKTVSMGIVEHPGVSALGYGVPISIILLSKIIMGILWAFDRLVIASMISYLAFLFVLAHSELRDNTHVFSGFFAFGSFLLCHWYVMKKVYPYYMWNVAYKWTIWFVALMYIVLGIVSLADWDSGGYVTYELCCIAALLLLQLFSCHVMLLMSPTDLTIKLSPLLAGDTDDVGGLGGMDTPRFSVDGTAESAVLSAAGGGASGTTGRDANEV